MLEALKWYDARVAIASCVCTWTIAFVEIVGGLCGLKSLGAFLDKFCPGAVARLLTFATSRTDLIAPILPADDLGRAWALCFDVF